MGPIPRWALGIVWLLASATAAGAQTVTFAIDATANVKSISRYIYGINEYDLGGARFPNLAFRRVGGNRWTAYNWENNASNAGSDYIFQNDSYLGGGNTPGGAVIPMIANASSQKAGLLLTVPIQGYVAADKKGDGDVHNTPNYLHTRFRESKPVKGTPFLSVPDRTDKFVYQDEFVNWVKKKYPYSVTDPRRPIWFSLDNEPDLWAETHAEVHPAKPTYAELVSKGSAYAKAIKSVMPNTKVFGPASYGWYGYTRLQGAPDANNRDFLQFYLHGMKGASTTAGKRLLDVLDLHWYPEAQSGTDDSGIRITANNTSPAVVAARLQAPRSLWDPTYKENSWIVRDDIQQPIKLIPRMLAKIAAANGYPGTRLAITEYNYGAGRHISGGIAQADVLGIFGREGLFAANQFPLIEPAQETFVQGAFKMYRNFDGANGAFGDRSVKATTTSTADTSVYASTDTTDRNRMVIIAINKTDAPINGRVMLSHAKLMKTAKVYRLTETSTDPRADGIINITTGRAFNVTLPAYSVTTLELAAR
jgi:hypothetical protein